MGKRLMGAFTVMLALVTLSSTVWAQGTTGTIRGKVTDSNTGDPLAAVNVFVLETDGTATTMGAFTNADGDYVIINVPPGMYMLRATMVGYKTTEVEDLLVMVGVSTAQSFQLEPTVLDVGEVVTVTHEREMIQRDVAATQQSYSIEEMERMAVSSTQEILQLQTNTLTMTDNFNDDIPGYYDRGLEQVHMRGGRNAEVAFMIDGMQVTNLVFGGQAASVSPFSLSEMVVMAGGMSAEFGNAMSGVVNMVTREGGRQLDANVEVLSSEFTGAQQDDIRDLTRFQGYLGGPVPMISKASFFLSGSVSGSRDYTVQKDDYTYDLYIDPYDETTRRADIDYYDMPEDWADFDYEEDNPYRQRETGSGYDWRIYPSDIYAGWLGYGFNNSWTGMANLTYKLTPSMKMTFSGNLNGSDRTPFTNAWRYSMFWGLPSEIQDNCVWGTQMWSSDPQYIGDPRYTGDTWQNGDISNTGLTDFHNEKNVVDMKNQRLAFVWTHQLGQSTFYSIRGSYYDYNRAMRADRFVNEDGYVPRYEHLYPIGSAVDDTLWHVGDAMTQVRLEPMPYAAGDSLGRRYGYFPIGSAGYGSDGSDRYYSNDYQITRTIKADITSQVTTHHQVKTGAIYNVPTMDTYDVQLLYLTPPYITQYRRTPWELGLYIQDKVEYDFIILNLGLRYDAANAGEIPYWIDPRNPIDSEGQLVVDPSDPETAPIKTGELRSQFSPRIGISHPITERSVMYFNYGHFFQNPIYRNLYVQGTLEDSVPLIGNPNMENEKTVQYEFGYKHQFTEIYALELTMYAKDTSNMVGSERIPAFFQGVGNPYDYTVFLNYDYSSSKGIDLSLIKRYSDFWSARVNYSYMTTQSNRDDPWAGYRGGHELETSPKRPRVLGWDQPHRVSSSISISIPQGVGPEVFGIRPFERFNASLIYTAAAGRPYTPTTKEKTLEPNSGRRPWTFSWSAKLYRDFESFGMRYSIFADVRNLFNAKNVRSVYSRTGSATDPGPGATSYSENYDRSWYFDRPRSIDIGIRIFF